MFAGTEETLAYALVALRDGVRLGVRPVFGGGVQASGPVLVGMRIRSCREDGLPADKAELTGAWPTLPFQKVSRKRASLEFGTAVPGALLKPEQLVARADAAGLWVRLADFVLQKCCGYAVVTQEELAAFLRDEFCAWVVDASASDGQPVESDESHSAVQQFFAGAFGPKKDPTVH